MSLFSFLGGLLGGGSQKKAAQKATDAQIAALNRGIDTQNAFNQQVRTDYMPYTTAGTEAVGKLKDFTGLNGADTLTSSLAGIPDDPRYKALYDSGQEAVLANASATGGIRGGNTQTGLARFGSDTLAQVYNMILSQFGGIANMGLGAQGTVTSAGQNTTNNVTGLEGDIGTTQANNYLAKGRIDAQNWQNAGSFIDDAVKSFLPGGGGLSSALKSIF